MHYCKVLFVDIDMGCQYLARRVMMDTTIHKVYGVKSGGFVPALLVSRYARKPIVFEEKHITKETLIITDVVYSMDIVHKYMNNKVACLYAKKGLENFLYFTYRTIPDDVFLVFCWDKEYEMDYAWFNGEEIIKEVIIV